MALGKPQVVFPSSAWSRHTHWCWCLQNQRYLTHLWARNRFCLWLILLLHQQEKINICSAVGIWLLIPLIKGFMWKKKGQARQYC